MIDNVESGHDKLILAIKEHGKDLDSWEQQFIDSLVEKAEKYGQKIYLSDKQRSIIERIHDNKVMSSGG